MYIDSELCGLCLFQYGTANHKIWTQDDGGYYHRWSKLPPTTLAGTSLSSMFRSVKTMVFSHLPVVQAPHPAFLLKIQYRSSSYNCNTQEAKRPPDKCALHLEWSPPRKHSCFSLIKRQYWPLLKREMVSQSVHLPCLGQRSLLLFHTILMDEHKQLCGFIDHSGPGWVG